MDGIVIFCKDGILRFQSSMDTTSSVPMCLIEKSLNIPSHRFFLQNLYKHALIEKGSTLGSFLLCLEPWAETVMDLTDRNVPAYIAAIRKPGLAKNTFDYIEIKKITAVERNMHHPEMPEGMDFIEWINTQKEYTYLDTFDIHSGIHINGYVDNETSNYGIDMIDMAEIKNVPLILNRTHTFMEYERKATADQGVLINKNTSGVKQYGAALYVESDNTHDFTLFDLFNTVFCDGLWHYSPQGAAVAKEELLQAISESEELFEQAEKPDLKLVDDDFTTTQAEVKEVRIAPNAFAPLVEHFENEKSEWDHILSKVEKNSVYPIKIGKIEEDVSSNNRLCGYKLDEPYSTEYSDTEAKDKE